MGRTWLFGIAGMLVFSGCIDMGGESKETSSSPSDSPASSSASAAANETTSATENATNEPPTAALEADNVTGALPLNVTFLLNGTDPEGGNLSWTLSFGDASENVTGDALPANATHTFTLEGNFTAMLEVSDGVNTANMTLAINVTTGASGEPQIHIITGSALVPFPVADSFVCLNDDIDGNVYDLAPAGPGWSYTLEPGDGSFGLYWYIGDSYQAKGTETGIVPDDIDRVEICSLSAAPGSEYTLTLMSP